MPDPDANPTPRAFPPPDPGYFEHERPELIARVPESAADVLDIGCGAGRLGARLKALRPVRVVGVESDAGAAAAARRRLDEVWAGDVEVLDLPFAPGSFDAVVCGDVLEHLRDPLAVLRRVRGWLRPGGVLVASVPNARYLPAVLALVKGNWAYEPEGVLDRTHLRFFTRRELEKLLFRAGFAAAAVDPLPGPGHAAWVVAGRPTLVIPGVRVGPLRADDAREFFAYQWAATARPDPPEEFGRTSVVVVAHNGLAHTRRCVSYVRHLTDEPYELVLVDNGSADGTGDYFRALAAADPGVKVVSHPENRGFPAGANSGMLAAAGSQVVLLNNDTVVTTGWLRRMLRALRAGPGVGLVGPCSNRVPGPQRVPTDYQDFATLEGFAWERARAEGHVETDRLAGFCLLVTRAVIDRVGLLDERFGVGNFEDDDYCERAVRAGFKVVIARDAFVHHVGGQTFLQMGIDYRASLRANREVFRAKWGPGVKTLGGHVVDQ